MIIRCVAALAFDDIFNSPLIILLPYAFQLYSDDIGDEPGHFH